MYQHILSGLLAAWLSIALLWAQHCPDKSISTDPDNPVSESGSIAVPNPFDWRVEYFPVNSEYQPPSATFIQSPFYHPNNGDLSHLVDSKDMQPEDGWELIT